MYNAELRPVVDGVLAPFFGTGADPAPLWATVTALDWHRIGVDDSAGGVGGDLRDLAEIAAGFGRHAVPLPLIETSLAAWTLARSGQSIGCLGDEPAVAAVVPPGLPGLAGALSGVRFLPAATHVVLVVSGEDLARVAVLPASGSVGRAGTDLAGEPVADLVLDGIALGDDQLAVAPPELARELSERAALLRSAALGGAVERAAGLVSRHVAVREQFGRPLLAQQAVAHGLAAIACERDLITHAVAAALAAPSAASFVAARATAARSAGIAAGVAHQLMGAMGITREHPLHLVTRRLWAWRDEAGTQRQWEQRLGEHVLTGADDGALWDLATGELC